MTVASVMPSIAIMGIPIPISLDPLCLSAFHIRQHTSRHVENDGYVYVKCYEDMRE